MEPPQSNSQTPVYSYTRTELRSLRTKTSLLSLSTVDRLKDLNIVCHLARRHRSSRGVKRKKENLHSFIVASFSAQSVMGNDMVSKRSEISMFIKDNGVDLLFVAETWLRAQGDEAKTVELAPSGFDVKPWWWWWCRSHPVREHAQDLRPPLGARPASPPTRQAAQPPQRGPSTNPRPVV